MNNTFYSKNDYRNYIAHFGVKGMKWGVRRYQNANGSYTSAGKRRYGVGDGQSYSPVGRRGGGSASPDQRTARRARLKKAALAVGGAAALAGAGYLAYKHNNMSLRKAFPTELRTLLAIFARPVVILEPELLGPLVRLFIADLVRPLAELLGKPLVAFVVQLPGLLRGRV